jgi:hypothetical protein
MKPDILCFLAYELVIIIQIKGALVGTFLFIYSKIHGAENIKFV